MTVTYVSFGVVLIWLFGYVLTSLIGSSEFVRVLRTMSIERLIYFSENARMLQKRLRWSAALSLLALCLIMLLHVSQVLYYVFLWSFLTLFVAQRIISKIVAMTTAEERFRRIEGQKENAGCNGGVLSEEPAVKCSDMATSGDRQSGVIAKFDNVWYLPHKRTLLDGKFLAFDDVGCLTVSDKGATFIGANARVEISGVTNVSFGKQGRDFINKWVKVEYQDKIAFFADGRERGWSGIFGGTREILAAVKNLENRSTGNKGMCL